MRSFTVVLIPGGGVQGVEVAYGTTLQQLANDNGWTDREMTLNDVQVPRNEWADTVLDQAVELFAVRPVKGN